nr:MAG: hypothetical protein [Parvovirinae sp.]
MFQKQKRKQSLLPRDEQYYVQKREEDAYSLKQRSLIKIYSGVPVSKTYEDDDVILFKSDYGDTYFKNKHELNISVSDKSFTVIDGACSDYNLTCFEDMNGSTMSCITYE